MSTRCLPPDGPDRCAFRPDDRDPERGSFEGGDVVDAVADDGARVRPRAPQPAAASQLPFLPWSPRCRALPRSRRATRTCPRRRSQGKVARGAPEDDRSINRPRFVNVPFRSTSRLSNSSSTRPGIWTRSVISSDSVDSHDHHAHYQPRPASSPARPPARAAWSGLFLRLRPREGQGEGPLLGSGPSDLHHRAWFSGGGASVWIAPAHGRLPRSFRPQGSWTLSPRAPAAALGGGGHGATGTPR
jgi:hypothetical protein